MKKRNLNPNNHGLSELARAARDIRTARIDAEAEAKRLTEERVAAARFKLQDALARAKQAGVGVTLMAETTGYSRNAIYEFFRDMNPILLDAAKAETAPFSTWFAATDTPGYVRMTLQESVTPKVGSTQPKGAYAEVKPGHNSEGLFRVCATEREVMDWGGGFRNVGGAYVAGTAPQLIEKFRAWAAVAMPELDTTDHTPESAPEKAKLGRPAKPTTIDDLWQGE